MRAARVTLDIAHQFIDYCGQHLAEHDDSYPPSAGLLLTEGYPAYVLMDGPEVKGAVCLICTAPYRQARKGRLLILHTSLPGDLPYRLLLDAVLAETSGLDFIYGFIPGELQSSTGAIWERLGLYIERRSYMLRYDAPVTPEVSLPDGYRLEPLGIDDAAAVASFAVLLNLNFAQRAGHVDTTPEGLREILTDQYHLPDGIMLMYHGEQPVGTLGVAHEEGDSPDAGFIAMLSVHPEHRGRGLGRALLREGIRAIRAAGYLAAELSVNAENENAVHLYLSEGFYQTQLMLCYRLDLA